MMSNELAGQLIIFSLAGRLFGLDVKLVQEILPAVPLRSLPRSASHLRGLIDFRGQIIPVLNLRSLLRLPQDQELRSIVVIQFAGRNYGLMVDGVREVLGADEKAGQQDQLAIDLPEHVILSVVQIKQASVVVLRVEALLAPVQAERGVC